MNVQPVFPIVVVYETNGLQVEDWTAAELSHAQQITSAAVPLFRVVEAPDGNLLATSTDGKLWSLPADGSRRTLFTDLS